MGSCIFQQNTGTPRIAHRSPQLSKIYWAAAQNSSFQPSSGGRRDYLNKIIVKDNIPYVPRICSGTPIIAPKALQCSIHFMSRTPNPSDQYSECASDLFRNSQDCSETPQFPKNYLAGPPNPSDQRSSNGRHDSLYEILERGNILNVPQICSGTLGNAPRALQGSKISWTWTPKPSNQTFVGREAFFQQNTC